MSCKAVFLDRDDTIVDDPGYISHPDQLKLLPGAAQALRDMRKLGFKLVIVSNQSGVARGMLTEETLAEIHRKLKRLLADENVDIDSIYYCPYHPEGVVEEYSFESDLRKPSPGMLFKAAKEMDIDLSNSWMVGDSYRDVAAGKEAGCKTILVNIPGKSKSRRESDPEPDFHAVNIKESANIIRMQCQKITKKESEAGLTFEPAKSADSVSEKKKNLTKANLKRNESQRTVSSSIVPKAGTVKNVNYKGDEQGSKSTSEKSIEYTLSEILSELKKQKKERQYTDFSLVKMFAGLLQVVVVFCLLMSLMVMMEDGKSELSMFKPLAFAGVVQLMSLTLYLMDERKN